MVANPPKQSWSLLLRVTTVLHTHPELDHMHLDCVMWGWSGYSTGLSKLINYVLYVNHLVSYFTAFPTELWVLKGKDSSFLSFCSLAWLTTWLGLSDYLVTCFGESRVNGTSGIGWMAVDIALRVRTFGLFLSRCSLSSRGLQLWGGSIWSLQEAVSYQWHSRWAEG